MPAKKDVYNAQIKNTEDKIPHITNLATKTTLNAKINEFKGEMPNINAVENKMRSVSNLVKKLTLTQVLMKLKRKLLIILMVNLLLLYNLINLPQKLFI